MSRIFSIALLMPVLALIGCATKTVAMPDAETKRALEHYDTGDFGKGVKLEWMKIRNYCDDTTGKCWDLECKGASSDVTCWKTPTAMTQELGLD